VLPGWIETFFLDNEMTNETEIKQQLAECIFDAGYSADADDVQDVIDAITEENCSIEKYTVEGPRAWNECGEDMGEVLPCGVECFIYGGVQMNKGEPRKTVAAVALGDDRCAVWMM